MASRSEPRPRDLTAAPRVNAGAAGESRRSCSVARGLPITPAGGRGCGTEADVHFDRECPLEVRVVAYPRLDVPQNPLRHDYLEILVGLDGTARLNIGERLVEVSAGDVIAIDANQDHALTAFWGWRRRLLHVRFRPELVYNLGSPMCDYVFLSPFYFQSPGTAPVLSARHPSSKTVLSALRQLVLCSAAAGAGEPRAKAGSKAFLLEVIYLLSEHLHVGAHEDTARDRQSQRTTRLSGLIDYLDANFGERITVDDAASLVNMSRTPFMKLFRQATGNTFVAYLNGVRLKHGRRLLRDTDLPIAQVAATVGFADQSYFDRRFRALFGEAPRECRRQAETRPIGPSDGPGSPGLPVGGSGGSSSGAPADPATAGGRARTGPRGRR